MANLEDSCSSVTAQSEYPGYPASLAYDNNAGTAWASYNGYTDAWIQFNWASPVTIREIVLTPHWVGAGWGRPRFTFSDGYTTDGHANAAASTPTTYILFTPKVTTSLRISIIPDLLAIFGTSVTAGFSEVEIRDTYTVEPTGTILDYPDHVSASHNCYNNMPVNEMYNAIDANLASRWLSNSGSEAWIQLDWDSPVTIGQVQLWDWTNDPGYMWGVPRFTFSDSSTEDGGEAVAYGGDGTTYVLSAPKSTTSLKISVASGGGIGSHGLMEIKLSAGNPIAQNLAGMVFVPAFYPVFG